jgi:dynein light intermediate chain
MDELIRQIAITTPETGTLLVQIRDEINMSLSGYETIFSSANGFGSRKALQAELGKEEKREEVLQLQSQVDQYKKQMSELKETGNLITFETG